MSKSLWTFLFIFSRLSMAKIGKRPTKVRQWNDATHQELLQWFFKYTGKPRDLSELASGTTYCQLLLAHFPYVLDKSRIQLRPSCQTERVINWILIHRALEKLNIDEEVNVVERSRLYDPGNLDFCRWFVQFYSDNNGKTAKRKIASQVHQRHKTRVRGDGWISGTLDDYGISKKRRSLETYWREYGSKICISEAESEVIFGNGYDLIYTTQKIMDMFDTEEGKQKLEMMNAKWNRGFNKLTGEGGYKNEEIPSMWDYNGRCLPREFADLDPNTFLVEPAMRNISFLPKDLLAKICKNLSVKDFLNLSLACRFLHWKMFTFCTCYAPYTAFVHICDGGMDIHNRYYSFELLDVCVSRDGAQNVIKTRPTSLKKPFIFECLELELQWADYNKEQYDKYLPEIMAYRKRAINFIPMFSVQSDRHIDYSATNEFLKALSATSFRASDEDFFKYPDDTTKIYQICPYARKMDEIRVNFNYDHLYPFTAFENLIGFYENPPVDAVLETLKNFIDGSESNAKYHIYLFDIEHPESVPENTIFEFLFGKFNEFVEYFCEDMGNVWIRTIESENNQRRLLVKIRRNPDLHHIISIGDKNTFEELDTYYLKLADRDWETILWKMETAVEGGSEE